MTYSVYDSTESITSDSDIDDEQIRKMLVSQLYIRDREKSEWQKSSSLLWTRKLNAPFFLESRGFRETRCDVCTEARSKCKATSSLSLRTRKLVDRFVPRDQSFKETWYDVFMSRCFSDLQTQQVFGNHFLMETRIICLIKQNLNEFIRQEHQVGSFDNCIEELQ